MQSKHKIVHALINTKQIFKDLNYAVFQISLSVCLKCVAPNQQFWHGKLENKSTDERKQGENADFSVRNV